MEYLTLNNGVQMPLVGFGTFMLSGGVCVRSVAAAIESGYRMIDTAEAYGNEKEVGEGIRQSGMDRGELFLVTKVNFKSYENAEPTVMQSLANLQTDYIDLLLLHWPFANYYAAWRALETLYEGGKVRAIGVSNFEPDQLLDLIAYNKVIPAVNQIETNLYCQRSPERGWIDKKNVAHMAYAPLGQGNRNEMFSESAVLALAEKYGKTPAQVLLRFLTQKGIAVIQKLLFDTSCHLTLFARHARDVHADTDRITAVNGDAGNPEDLKAVLPGQDVVYCAISGDALPQIAENIVAAMEERGVERLIFMAAVGIYNEIPDEIDGEDNLDNEPAQIPNRRAADVVETSSLNYAVLRPGYLGEGGEDECVLTCKGEAARGYTTPIPALVKFVVRLILNENLSRQSVSITRDVSK